MIEGVDTTGRRDPDAGSRVLAAVAPEHWAPSFFGVAITAVQWFMHYYLPHKIASASEVMGTLGITVASLSYLFIIGRTMAATLVINAVLFERLGSISELVFALPVLRRVPVRFPSVGRFFDLKPGHGASEGSPPAPPHEP